MDNAFLINIFRFLNYTADSIFSGLKILVPIVLLLKLVGARLKFPDMKILVDTLNTLMLTGGFLFLISMTANVYRAVNSENTMERDFMIGLITGPHWFQLLIPFLVYAILPNILLVKSVRKSIFTSAVIWFSWLSAFYLVDYLTTKEDQSLFKHSRPAKWPLEITVEKAILFLAFFLFIYLMIYLKRKRSIEVAS